MRKNTKPPGPGETRAILEEAITGDSVINRLVGLGIPDSMILAIRSAKNKKALADAVDVAIKWFMEEEGLTEELAVHVLNGGRVVDFGLDAV